MDKSFRRKKYKARFDLFFFDATNTQAHLICTAGAWDFVICLVIEGADRDFLSVGHYHVRATFLAMAGFDLAFYHSAHIFVPAVDRHHEGRFDFTFWTYDVVKVFEECWAIVPGCKIFGRTVLYAYRRCGRYWHKMDLKNISQSALPLLNSSLRYASLMGVMGAGNYSHPLWHSQSAGWGSSAWFRYIHYTYLVTIKLLGRPFCWSQRQAWKSLGVLLIWRAPASGRWVDVRVSIPFSQEARTRINIPEEL